jgi:uncharacterized protein YidB (DUF937 family)
MSRGFPSMTALLGILAVAGYQNRDKLAEMLGSMSSGSARAPGPANLPQGQTGGLGDVFGGAGVGSMLSSGLRNLVDRFRQAGHGEAADSWLRRGRTARLLPTRWKAP